MVLDSLFPNLILHRHDRQFLLLAAGGLVSLACVLALRHSSSASARKSQSIIRSPRTTLLPHLSEDEIANLPYPPDALPGARDVASPYGTVRLYEWGPEDGGKVLLVHGISTPCVALGGVAKGLVDKGYRVMLVDLFGRGYSDTPTDLPHDARLYASELLIALTSSPLSWTGSSCGKFALIGYSLGGGIAAAFTSSFPHLVSSLILLAPSGLLRPNHISTTSKLLYSTGLVPESLLECLVRRRLESRPSSTARVTPTEQSTTASGAVEEELPKQESSGHPAEASPHLTVAAAVVRLVPFRTPTYPAALAMNTHTNTKPAQQWQLKFHSGFIKAFMSSIRHGPITEQHHHWARIGHRLAAQNATTTNKDVEDAGLRNGKVLIVCGEQDAIIAREELMEDAERVLMGNVEFRLVDAGHEFPITRAGEVVGFVMDFWRGAA